MENMELFGSLLRDAQAFGILFLLAPFVGAVLLRAALHVAKVPKLDFGHCLRAYFIANAPVFFLIPVRAALVNQGLNPWTAAVLQIVASLAIQGVLIPLLLRDRSRPVLLATAAAVLVTNLAAYGCVLAIFSGKVPGPTAQPATALRPVVYHSTI